MHMPNANGAIKMFSDWIYERKHQDWSSFLYRKILLLKNYAKVECIG